MFEQTIQHTIKRYQTLATGRITALPVVILMPHSACNCKCVMCDIWKDNKNLKQLTENDILDLISSFKKYGTQKVVMSGGEALINQRFFSFCEILKRHNIKVSLLSTGLLLKKNAHQIAELVDDLIVSLDGDRNTHDLIRNIPGAFDHLREGIAAIRLIDPNFKISGRTVIHRYNFRIWASIIDSAKQMGLDRISFLPADVSSTAFNREIPWNSQRQNEILIGWDELPDLQSVIDDLLLSYTSSFEDRFIAESPEKIRQIYDYYVAYYRMVNYPSKKCNAPWVSAVIEADGAVKPCFFHKSIGNIRNNRLDEILNSSDAINFRKQLDVNENIICKKCVCHLNLPARSQP